ncbi:hypothetical protein GCM10022254_10000 [Actinomadura meridiana]|uniref:Uncharacterized protein n=1 Tax=Actinomadura meridiana TaxID=559626 RepID=A0ABP8BUH9_9ACTN
MDDGFEFEGNIYNLRFQTPSHKGLEVRAESVAVGEFRRLMRLAVELQDDDGNPVAKTKFTPEQVDALDGLLEGFSRALVSWNLKKRGAPVPATPDGLDSMPLEFVFPVIKEWFTAVGGVAEDSALGKDSPSGVTFPESSLPMAPPSLNLGSLTTQS